MTTTADTRAAWDEVADHLSALGLKLQLHLHEVGAAAPSSTEVGKALRQLGAAIDDTCSAIGNAVQDPAVRDDATHLADSLAGALVRTLSEAGEELTEVVKGIRRPPEG
jgi:hypothetical protein